MGRTLVRIDRHLAALRTALSPMAEGAFSLGVCRGHQENAPRGRNPAGGPGAGELFQSRVEAGVVDKHPSPIVRTAGAPKLGPDSVGARKFPWL